MAEEDIPFLALMVRIDKFGVLYFLEVLDLRLHQRISSIRVNTLGLDSRLDFIFSFLIHVHLPAQVRSMLVNLPC